MTREVDFYDSHYGHLATDPQVEVRRETFGEDLGQVSWMTAAEARRWFNLLQLNRGKKALEVACGSGGVTSAMARGTGAACVGVDINTHAIEAARHRAERDGIAGFVSFQLVDVGPFPPSPSMPCFAMTPSTIFPAVQRCFKTGIACSGRGPCPVHRSHSRDGSIVERGDSRTELHRILSLHSRGT